MAFALLFWTLGAASAQPAAPLPVDGPAVIVTGKRLSDTERGLEECLARNCPPDEDIDATLAHAENLFVAGSYNRARSVVRRSIGRNGRQARSHPVAVSDLYRAASRIAAHLGEGDEFRRTTFASRRALRAGLPKEDPRYVAAHLEVASMYAEMGRLDSAHREYGAARDLAEQIGRPDLAAIARVRAAWLHSLGGRPYEARTALRKMVADSRPGSEVARLTAKILLARLDRQSGKTDSSDELIAQLRGASEAPLLLFSPQFQLGSGLTNYEGRWIDVGFWITPEGRASDVEILRQGGPADWARPLLRAIAGRTYAPLDGPAGSYRVERYTYTARWTSVTASRLRVRGSPRIEYLDLTAEPERDGE